MSLIAILTLAFSVALPPFQLCDEHAHFLRAYGIANGHLLGDRTPEVPDSILALIQRYPEMFNRQVRIQPSAVVADLMGRAPQPANPQPLLPGDSGHQYLAWGIVGTNIYSPVAYLPAAAGITVARLFGASPLALLYAARFANALLFTAAMALVFRLAPEWRVFFTSIALLPMTLHQVGGVSGDTAAIAAAFIGFSIILAMRNGMISRGFLIAAALAFGVWMTCKPSPWALGVVLLIPPRCFTRRRSWLFYLASVAGVMIASAVIWQFVSRANMEAFRVSRLSHGIDLSANSAYLLGHPFESARSIAGFAASHYRAYIGQMVGVFGWKQVALPMWTRALYLAFVILVAIAEPLSKDFTKWERLLLFGVSLAGVIFIHCALLVSDASWCDGNGMARSICFNNSAGIQGRYFIPVAIFGLATFRWRRIQVSQPVLMLAAICVGGAYAGLSVMRLWSAFYG